MGESFPALNPVLARLVRGWANQLLVSPELALLVDKYPDHQYDVTLFAASGQVARKPAITVRPAQAKPRTPVSDQPDAVSRD